MNDKYVGLPPGYRSARFLGVCNTVDLSKGHRNEAQELQWRGNARRSDTAYGAEPPSVQQENPVASYAKCPHCQRVLSIVESNLGREIQCLGCGRSFVAQQTVSPPPLPKASQGTVRPPPLPIPSPPIATPQVSSVEYVDLNSGTEQVISELPGVGPILAKKAVKFRATQRPFQSLDDFAQVLGLKPHVIERLRTQARATLIQEAGTPERAGRVVDF